MNDDPVALSSNPMADNFDVQLKGLIFSLSQIADDMADSPHGKARARRIREAIPLLESFNVMHAERDRLRLERDEWQTSWLRVGNSADIVRAERDRLRAAQSEAVRVLSAVEFDGQAYDAITKACALLSGERPAPETGAYRCPFCCSDVQPGSEGNIFPEITAHVLTCAKAHMGEVVGWMVGDWQRSPAMYNLTEREKAFDAAKRWDRPITAVVLDPRAPCQTALPRLESKPAWDCKCEKPGCPYCDQRRSALKAEGEQT